MVALMVEVDFVTSACKRIENAAGDWVDWAKGKQLLDGGPSRSGHTERENPKLAPWVLCCFAVVHSARPKTVNRYVGEEPASYQSYHIVPYGII